MSLPIDPLGDAWRVLPPPRIARPGFVLPMPVDPDGRNGPTYGQARGGRWRRTSPNRYVPADAVVDQPAQRIVEVAGHLTAGGAVTGWASLHLTGARYFEGKDGSGAEIPVQLAMGRDRHRMPPPGTVTDRRRLDSDEIEMRCGVPCTAVHRAMLDEIRRRGDLWERVCVVDMACYAELTSVSRFRTYVLARTRGRERTFLLRLLELAVEGSESPQETGMRRIWVGPAGLPPPVANRNVYDLDGRFLGRPDLLDPEAGLVGEYDGEHHRETAARRRDLAREDEFRNHGLEYFSLVSGEMHDQDRVVARIRAARGRALTSAAPRSWTLQRRHGARELDLDERIELRVRHRLPLAGPGFAAAEFAVAEGPRADR
jgi:hypothetical protein